MESGVTHYKIVYQLSNRIKTVVISAASPMLAFKKFKEMMPSIMYKSLSINDIEEQITEDETIKEKKCYASNFIIKKAS